MYSAAWSDSLTWAFTATGSLSDTTIFNAQLVTPINYVEASAQQKASTKFGRTLVLGDISAGHVHLQSTLTKGQLATAKSGTPVTLTSQFQSTPSSSNHSHTLVLSWRDGWIIEVSGNHGHDVTIKEAA